MATVDAARPRAIERWAGLGAILYVALLIGGTILGFSGTPDSDDPPAKYVSYFGDSGHRTKIGVGWILVVLGVFFLLWFLAALRQLLLRTEGESFLTSLATIGGAVYASLTLVGTSVYMAIATMSDDTFQDRVYPGIVHAGGDAGYVIHAAGGIGAGAMIIAASLAMLRAGLIARWTGILFVIFGVIGLASIVFFPQALIAIWLIVVGILLFRWAGRPAAPPPAPAV